MRLSIGLAAVLSLPVGLGGCTAARVGKNIGTNVAAQKQEFREILGGFKDTKAQPISWNEAHKRMTADNLSLRQSRLQMEESKKEKTRQWLTLVPRVSSYANIGAGISELSDLGSDDLNASLLANFNIPNPFQFYASLYAASLQEQNAIWSHELDKRRAYTELYSAFVDGEAIDEAETAYEKRLKSLMTIQSADMARLMKSVTLELQNLERRRLHHRLYLNQLLNTPGANWKLVGKLPKISYAGRYRNMAVGDDFGKLALNLQAIQIEGAILRVQQVKFQQWPYINFGLSAPPLYSSNTANSFSSDDLQLFSGAAKSFDLTDIGGRRDISNAETRLRFTREQLRLRAESEASRILQLVQNYENLLKENRYLRREIERLSDPGSTEAEIVIADLERLSEFEILLIENKRQIQQLDLQLLIWDDTYWN